MNMIQWISTIFHGRFMALSWHSKIVEIHHIIFISDSCHFHGAFMALYQTEPQTVSCHFHGTFPENYFKIVIIGYIMFVCVCVCVSICRQCFFSSFDIFSLMVFQVDQSFCFFFDQNIGL